MGRYNPHLPLVIDPAYRFSTFLGGSNIDYGYGIAVDSNWNAYITGTTISTDFPTANPEQGSNAGSYDAFVSKLNATGTALAYSTYLGGSVYDQGNAIAVDGSGDAYVTGYTSSSLNFPITPGAFQMTLGGGNDVFVSKLNSLGTALVYSTYLGGTGDDEGGDIALDASGNSYVTGLTTSTTFPTASPWQASSAGGKDAFVTKLNATGTALAYSTYLGGSGNDIGSGIAVDASGNAYVTGSTASSNFPTNPPGGTSNGSQDVFVTKINATGSALIYSTYLGGSGTDVGNGIAVDASGDAYVTGFTSSNDFPLANPLQASYHGGGGDGFVTKLNASGSLDLFSTYLGGGSGFDQGSSIAVGTGGNVYVTGWTNSSDFPTANAEQPSLAGWSDAFVTKIETLPTPVFTPGVFRPSAATFLLHNANTSGIADESVTFGAGTDVPVVGDWTGKGYRSIGVFRNGAWFLRNKNVTGGADITVYFGSNGDIPVAGDWTGKGYDSIGIFRPSTGTWYLRNSNTGGTPNITVNFGTTGDIPVVGDWTGKGYDSIGIYRPSLGAFFLRNSNTPGGPNLTLFFGALGDTPLVGDWTSKGYDSVGVYRPSTSTFYLRNSNTSGFYADLTVAYGASGDKPLVGQWLAAPGSSKPFRRSGAPARQAAATPTRRAGASR